MAKDKTSEGKDRFLKMIEGRKGKGRGAKERKGGRRR